MNLKTLLSVKFGLLVIHVAGLIFLMWHAYTTYNAIEEQNEILFRQKKYYEILLNDKDANKKELYSFIKDEDKNLVVEAADDSFSPSTYVMILMLAIYIGNPIFEYLNKRIELLKKETGNNEKLLQ